MSTQLPIRLYRPLHRQQLAPTSLNRLFSTSRPAFRNAKSRGRVDSVAASSAARHQHNKAPTAYQEEQLSDERNVPDDIGLVPGTFVHAPLFPLTRFSLSDRMWYEWKWIRSRLGSWIQLWRFRRSFDTTKKPIMHWWSSRAQLKYRALQKYKHLHESFAKGDSRAVSQLCISSVATKYQKRIEARPPGLQMEWSTIGEPTCKIVSNLASPLSLPGYEQTGIHQVILRIRSKQQLTVQKGLSPESKVEEYLVLQRQFIRGEAKDWKVWGFTNFSTRASIESDEEYARTVNEYQAV